MSDQPADATHPTFRELISARLDEPLALEDDWALSVHLVECARCRHYAADLAEQRRVLRALPSPLPPRDLWARTSAALDRELLRDARRGPAPRPSPRTSHALRNLTDPRSVPSMVAVSVASVSFAVVLLVTQLGPSIRLPVESGGLATPFGVPGVALAWVDSSGTGLTLYRTRVDRVCPAPVANCYREANDRVAAQVTFPASFEPSTLALTPRGDRLAIMGSDSERQNVFAVVVMPPLEPEGAPTAPPTPTRRPTEPPAAPSAPSPAATRAPAVSLGPSIVVIGTAQPDATPSAIEAAPSADATPTAPAPGSLTVATILEDVYGIGAPAAWSADGETLAFSAMPSDRSQGPDVYVWQVGDERARPITHDHRSYFASWAGNAIVVSRVERQHAELGEAPEIQLSTVAIDVAHGRERKVDGPPLWLPQVDPTGRYAVGWHGTLGTVGPLVVPQSGALYLIAWAARDPFARPTGAPGSAPGMAPDGQQSREPTDEPERSDEPEPSDKPGPSEARPDDEATDAPDGEVDPTPVVEPSLDAADPQASLTPAPSSSLVPSVAPSPPSATLDPRLVAIDPNRDPQRNPVVDWRVLWSPDGKVVAYWVGDPTVGAWGVLTVVSVDEPAGGIDRSAPLLPPTVARRGFNLADNRVAWVAPIERARTGELRVRIWGPTGVDDVRVGPVEVTGVVGAL